MTTQFAGRIALVTGGTGGLGKSVSLAFLREGAAVIASYVKKDEADALKDIAGAKAKLELLPLDATDEAACRNLIDGLVARYGQLDFLVNTIGAYAGGKPLWETDSKTFQFMLSLNLHAGYNLARAVAPVMLRRKSGSIINIAAKAAFDHAAGASAYAASKAGALALFDCLAQDLKGSGVRVNSILPSIIDTEPNRKAMPGADFTKWPKPEDIAQVILFLCCDQAKVVHGAAVPVYGESQ